MSEDADNEENAVALHLRFEEGDVPWYDLQLSLESRQIVNTQVFETLSSKQTNTAIVLP